MTSPPTIEERVSHLEGAYQLFELTVKNMVTREEMQAHMAAMLAAVDGVRSEMRTVIDGVRSGERTPGDILRSEIRIDGAILRLEMRIATEILRWEMRTAGEILRAELKAEIRAAFQEERADRRAAETRNTRWVIGAIFAAAALIIAAIQVLS